MLRGTIIVALIIGPIARVTITLEMNSKRQPKPKYQHSNSANVPQIDRTPDDEVGARSARARYSADLSDRCPSLSPTRGGCFAGHAISFAASLRRLRHGSRSRQSSGGSGGSVESRASSLCGSGRTKTDCRREKKTIDDGESSDSDEDDAVGDDNDDDVVVGVDDDDVDDDDASVGDGVSVASKSLRTDDCRGIPTHQHRRHHHVVDDRKSETRSLCPDAMGKSASLIDLKSLARKLRNFTTSGWFCCCFRFVWSVDKIGRFYGVYVFFTDATGRF